MSIMPDGNIPNSLSTESTDKTAQTTGANQNNSTTNNASYSVSVLSNLFKAVGEQLASMTAAETPSSEGTEDTTEDSETGETGEAHTDNDTVQEKQQGGSGGGGGGDDGSEEEPGDGTEKELSTKTGPTGSLPEKGTLKTSQESGTITKPQIEKNQQTIKVSGKGSGATILNTPGPLNMSGMLDLEGSIDAKTAQELPSVTGEKSLSSTLSTLSEKLTTSTNADSLESLQTKLSSFRQDLKSNPLELSQGVSFVASEHFNKASQMIEDLSTNIETSSTTNAKLVDAAKGQIGLGLKAIFTDLLSNPEILTAAMAKTMGPLGAAVVTETLTTTNPDLINPTKSAPTSKTSLTVPTTIPSESKKETLALGIFKTNQLEQKNSASIAVQDNSPSTNEMATILAAFGVAVMSDRVLEAQLESTQTTSNATISSFAAQEASAQAQITVNDYNAQAAEQAKEKKESGLMKIITIIVTVVVIVAIVASVIATMGADTPGAVSMLSVGVPLMMAAMMGASMVATCDNKNPNPMASELTKGLERLGMGSEDAKVLSAVIIAVAVTVLTCGAGAYMGAENLATIGLEVGAMTLSTDGGFSDMALALASATHADAAATIALMVIFNLAGGMASMASGVKSAATSAINMASKMTEWVSNLSKSATPVTTAASKVAESVSSTAGEGIELATISSKTATTAAKASSTASAGAASSSSAAGSAASAASAAQATGNTAGVLNAGAVEAGTVSGGAAAAVQANSALATSANMAGAAAAYGKIAESTVEGLPEVTSSFSKLLKQILPSFAKDSAAAAADTSKTTTAAAKAAAANAKTAEKETSTIPKMIQTFVRDNPTVLTSLNRILMLSQIGGNLTEGLVSLEIYQTLSQLANTTKALANVDAFTQDMQFISQQTMELTNTIISSYNQNTTSLGNAMQSMIQQEALGAQTSASGLQ